MKKIEVIAAVSAAYDYLVETRRPSWPNHSSVDYREAVHQRGKFESCGRTVPLRNGLDVIHWCRRVVCPTCADYFGRNLTRKLVCSSPNAAPEDFQMLTLVNSITPSLDDAFDRFKSMRKALRSAVDYRRSSRASAIDREAWKAFGITGKLEIDMFPAENFSKLGTEKQEQYRSLGFNSRAGAVGPYWVVTAHGLVHVGELGLEAVRAVLDSVSPIVHLQDLDATQSLSEAAAGIGGYAGKVGIQTGLALGQTYEWPTQVLADYIAACMRCSYGRQGFRLEILPKKLIKPKNEPVIAHRKSDEGMAVVIG